jgi:hypothetical protein
MNNRICIVHFQPLEYYPPAQNIIGFLSENLSGDDIRIVSTLPAPDVELFRPANPAIKIVRTGRVNKGAGRLGRLLFYVRFNLAASLLLFRFRPARVFYIETLSAFPAFLYKLMRKGTKVLVHYHEYTSPSEYQQGMALSRWLHKLEATLYPNADWISHTNSERMRFFLEDESLHFNPVQQHILPNYPPSSWKRNNIKQVIPGKLRIVYAGALSIDTMYIPEMVAWTEAQNGSVAWDIYSQQEGKELEDFLRSKKVRFVRFCGRSSYENLPDILHQYDVGVILYKGHIPNYVYNAPNKLFEYLVCGLDVWLPKQMLGSLSYVRLNKSPRVAAIDFDQLESELNPQLLGYQDLPSDPAEFTSENVLTQLLPFVIEPEK